MNDDQIYDYSLIGPNAEKAVSAGLAEAEWYTTPVPRDQMRKLLERRDGPAIRDTLIWFGILIATGVAGFHLWGSWWAILPFALYGVVYGTSSDSRWHEASHGTPFKTEWMNTALYEVASFMVMREPTPWRWSHTRHHSDTLVVGRDPEIAVPRPPSLWSLLCAFVVAKSAPAEFKKVFLHAAGKMTEAEKTYIPESAYRRTYITARIWLLIYFSVIGACIYFKSILPLMYIGLPSIYGAWLMPFFGLTQHAGLEENVLDHRLNCRTVKMNLVSRYLYWNMNYHIEHHMFPLVPYHNLPKLHKLVRDDHPEPYNGIIETFREIIPALLRQRKDPTYFVERKLPEQNRKIDDAEMGIFSAEPSMADAAGWIKVCEAERLHPEDAIRFNCDELTFALYKTKDGNLHATDGICTHGRTHLAEGFVIGQQIECPKHNGRFDMRDGSAQRDPVCVGLCTYDVKEEDGHLYLNLKSAGGVGAKLAENTRSYKVVSNQNVATFIKELVLEPVDQDAAFTFTPGDYIQLDIPAYEQSMKDASIDALYDAAWQRNGYYECKVANHYPTRRNYSLATNPVNDKQLRFNVRFSPPAAGHQAGVGSSYVFNLKPGDTVKAIGPFGDFHIKPTESEMVYIGGGAGMAPLRSHISHLFETLQTGRKVSYWYGARSLQEVFYAEYFEELAAKFDNFTFHLALSEPFDADLWTGHTGYIHEVADREYLSTHKAPGKIEYYLCGPPPMIQAVQEMLASKNVPASQIAFDEF